MSRVEASWLFERLNRAVASAELLGSWMDVFFGWLVDALRLAVRYDRYQDDELQHRFDWIDYLIDAAFDSDFFW